MKISLVMLSDSEYEAFFPIRAFSAKSAAEAFIASCLANSTEEEAYDNTWHITELEYTE
jgi:hypothetical protein